MLSPTVTTGGDLKWDEIPFNIGETRRLSPLVIVGHAEASGGERGIRTPDRSFEPIPV